MRPLKNQLNTNEILIKYRLQKSDAIVLFSANDLSQWESLQKKRIGVNWKISRNNYTVEPGTGDIITKQSFGDCQLQAKRKIPENNVQIILNFGNSGIYFKGLYEVQIYSSCKDEYKIYYNGKVSYRNVWIRNL